jgi:hypothetical protein
MSTYGEGFAFFRWHLLSFHNTVCRGINDDRPGFGVDGCAFIWKRLHRRG